MSQVFVRAAQPHSRILAGAPLPFAKLGSTLNSLPTPVRKKVDYLLPAVDRFQRETFRIEGDVVRVPHHPGNSASEDIRVYYRRVDEFFIRCRNRFLQEMRQYGETSESEEAEIERMIWTGTNQPFAYFFLRFFPRYFAQHGLFLYVDFVPIAGVYAPNVYLCPVRDESFGTARPRLLKNKTVRYRRYTLDASLTNTLDRYDRAFADPFRYLTLWGTDQVFNYVVSTEQLVNNYVESYLHLAGDFPSVRQGALLGPRQMTDPVARAHTNLLIRSVQESSKGQLATASRDELQHAIGGSLIRILEAHEIVHVADGQNNQGFWNQHFHDNLPSWFEARSVAGSASDERDIHLLTSIVFHEAGTVERRDIAITPPAKDVLYLRARLGYWLWQTTHTHSGGSRSPPTGRPIREFRELPAEAQDAVLNSFARLPPEELRSLYAKVWEELDQPDSPFFKDAEQSSAH